jgi:dUTP pyrophosphatase
VKLRVRRLDPSAALPAYAHDGDAGLDLVANAEVTVEAGARVMVPTGIAVAIPQGHAGWVLPRSGLASRHGITLANAPGLIDSGYRGEVMISVVNLDRTQAYTIEKGERIAQLVVAAYASVVVEETEELTESERGEGGFGSSGR